MDVENPPPSPPSPPSPPAPSRLPPRPLPLFHYRQQLHLQKAKCKDLYHAAINGDWKTAEDILRETPNYVRYSITTRKDTVLHVAALGGNKLFVRKVVEMLKSSEDLEEKNDYGCTAFYNAVVSGVVENAKCMIEKNQRLLRIRSYSEITPIHQAALQRHKDMVSYLYTVKPLEEYLERQERIKLLKITIYNHMHDVALKILKEDRTLALTKFKGNRSFLHMLVHKQRIAPTGGDKQEAGIWQRFFGSTSALFSTRFLHNGIEEERLAKTEAGELLGIIWEEYRNLADYEFREVITHEYEILHYAAKEGNVGFLDMILESKPDLFCERNKSGQTILHVAVLYRQQNVVSYICNKTGYKDIMTLLLDDNNNNILHLAAMAGNTLLCKSQDNAADDYLWIDEEKEPCAVPQNKKQDDHREEKIMPESVLWLSTAALQYERQISWFMSVEKIVPSSYHDMRNGEGKTPKQLFLKEHMELKINAEKSIRGTADSCMIVATLIATVAFSAAFTAPGGNDDKTGIPIFIKRASFTVFTISDAVAMIFSMVSILTFLSILIWRNTDDDFHLALKRLFVGFAALGVSICGMLFAFTAVFFLAYGRAWQPILIAAFVALPIASFLYLNDRLWIDVVGSMLLKLLPFTKQTTYVGG
ncbi:PREDICTED: ankyrin repeat-containing protein NPR4-like [Ipomoea nil]|uniref:ankyrin repeat-containing protein NPR4-like n=1 Tax=Ipomoea nil TaxID=35883 RepID=UPI0009008FDA|nr:PREDICTED: ankyrin repeat-containing protein NPR4-like [Ipomoea nil]